MSNIQSIVAFNHKRVLSLLLIGNLLALQCLAQKEANVWIFDEDLGIDFNFDRFTPFNGTGIDQPGGSASICDKTTGALLFYTDGRNVWNRNFALMPNGTQLRGGYTSDQAALIVPYPGDDNLYYLFTTKSYSDTIPLSNVDSEYSGLYYSVIDMRLNKGLGDVVKQTKNTRLTEKSTEKLTAVPHINGRDYWVITHEWGTDRFVVFPLTDTGVGSPDYFSFGPTYGHYESQGRLHASPDGRMLACAVSSLPIYELANPLELYNFNAATGIISNRRVLGNYPQLYGVSFSPDNSKLYFSFFDNYRPYGERLFQLDLNAGETEAIINTQTLINFVSETGIGGNDTISGGMLHLAPDGRLYISIFGLSAVRDGNEVIEKNRMFFLNKPNLPGLLCEPSRRDLDANLSSGHSHSFPNFIQSHFNNLEPVDNSTTFEDCAVIDFNTYPNPTNGYVSIKSEINNCLFPGRVKVYNSLGQLLNSFEVLSEPFPSVDFSGYSPGIYYLVIETFNRSSVRQIIRSL